VLFSFGREDERLKYNNKWLGITKKKKEHQKQKVTAAR
jgi:hypothetical protein